MYFTGNSPVIIVAVKLIIFASRSEATIDLFEEACRRYGVSLKVIFFDEMSCVDGKLFYKGVKLSLDCDKFIIRWPWNAYELREDYNVYVQELLEYRDKVFLDYKCLLQYSPFYEDKLFQSFIFKKLGVNFPNTYHFSKIDDASILLFPLIVKKRVASRWRNNFVINNYEELKKKLDELYIGDFIFQPFLEIARDIRVMVYKGKVVATVEKDVIHEGEGVVRVKYTQEIEIGDKKVLDDSVRVAEHLGADLVGVDVLELKDGSYTFLEANLSPQFSALKRSTGKDVADLIIRDLVSKSEAE